MADQAQNVAGKAQGATGAAGGLTGTIEGATSGILGSISGFGNWIAMKGMQLVDRFFPPEQRSKFLAMLQNFMLKNPKLSTFLGMNIAITGVPLFLFILFSITVFIFSLLVGLVLGLLAAVLFTVFCVGVALMFVLPTVFFTTMAACFLFLWGLGGYYILRWANGDKKDEKAPEGSAVGDKLNNLTGGRLTGFMDQARGEAAKGDISGFGDKYTPPNHDAPKEKKPQENGTAHKEPKQEVGKTVSDHATKATKASGVDNAHKKAADTAGTVKGGLSGATGLV